MDRTEGFHSLEDVLIFEDFRASKNDYILALASANAHQERYFKHDLQVYGILFSNLTNSCLGSGCALNLSLPRSSG